MTDSIGTICTIDTLTDEDFYLPDATELENDPTENVNNEFDDVANDISEMLRAVEKLRGSRSEMLSSLNDDLEGMVEEAGATRRNNDIMISEEEADARQKSRVMRRRSSSFNGGEGRRNINKSKDRMSLAFEDQKVDYTDALDEELSSPWEEEEISSDAIVYNIKIIVVGDAGVGKTSLIRQITRQKFSEQVMPTLGVDYSAKNIVNNDHSVIRLNLWDVAGQERYRCLSRAYLRGCQACVVVFDVTRPETLSKVEVWKKDIDTKCGKIPSLLLGNKNDLKSLVTKEQLKNTKDILDFSTACFTSATKFKPLVAMIKEFAGEVCKHIVHDDGPDSPTDLVDLKKDLENNTQSSKCYSMSSLC